MRVCLACVFVCLAFAFVPDMCACVLVVGEYLGYCLPGMFDCVLVGGEYLSRYPWMNLDPETVVLAPAIL